MSADANVFSQKRNSQTSQMARTVKEELQEEAVVSECYFTKDRNSDEMGKWYALSCGAVSYTPSSLVLFSRFILGFCQGWKLTGIAQTHDHEQSTER